MKKNNKKIELFFVEDHDNKNNIKCVDKNGKKWNAKSIINEINKNGTIFYEHDEENIASVIYQEKEAIIKFNDFTFHDVQNNIKNRYKIYCFFGGILLIIISICSCLIISFLNIKSIPSIKSYVNREGEKINDPRDIMRGEELFIQLKNGKNIANYNWVFSTESNLLTITYGDTYVKIQNNLQETDTTILLSINTKINHLSSNKISVYFTNNI